MDNGGGQQAGADERWRNRVIAYRRAKGRDLQTNPNNWRTHPDAQRTGLVNVLDEVGQVYPVLLNQRTGRLIDGHLRASLDPEAEWDVAVVDLSEEEEAIILATLDPLAAMAGADSDALAALLRQVQTDNESVRALLQNVADRADIDLSPYADFSENDIPDPEDPDADDFGEVRPRRGDLWLIESRSLPGQAHRLLCGDSTKTGDVARLMQGRRAVLFATDPLYLVGYTGANRPGSQGKDWTDSYHDADWWDDPAQGDAFYENFIAVAVQQAITEDAAWYCWHASRRQAVLERAWEKYGAFVHQQIIWVKDRGTLTYSWYLWQHEPCFFGWVKGQKPKRMTQDCPSSIWEFPTLRVGTSGDHPTPKPIELFTIPMEQHTERGDLCYEPFSGSGSQLVAGETLGRLVYGLELEPRYCEVILRRAEALGCVVRLAERTSEDPAGAGRVEVAG